MNNSLKNSLFNSTLAFVAAFIATTIFHELGHYLGYLFFKDDPTLFHNYVQSSGQLLSMQAKITISLAGPFFSLFQGIGFGMLISKAKENSAKYLFFLWLSLLGVLNFFGYLIMTPLSTVGDTGKVAQLLQISIIIQIIIALLGFVFLIFLLLKIAKNFSHFIPAGLAKTERAKYVYSIMFFPIMIGSFVNAFLAFPAVAMLSIIYPATSAYAIMSSFGSILKAPESSFSKSEIEDGVVIFLLILTICAVAANRLLTFGIG